MIAGILGLLILLDATVNPERIAKQLDRTVRAQLGDVGSLQVKVDSPRGIRGLNGHMDKVEIKIRRFDPARLDLEKLLGRPVGRLPQASAESPKPATRKRPSEVARIDQILIDASEFRFGETEVSRLVVALTNVDYNVQKAVRARTIELWDVEKTVAEVWIAEDALASLLTRRLPDIRNPRLRLGENKVIVSGQKEFSLVPLPFILTGRLEPRNRNEVNLVDPQLKIGQVPLPDAVVDALLRELNPLVRLTPETTRLPFELTLASLRVEEGMLRATALVRW